MDDAVVVGVVAVVVAVVAIQPLLPALLVFPADALVALPPPPALAGPTINVDVI